MYYSIVFYIIGVYLTGDSYKEKEMFKLNVIKEFSVGVLKNKDGKNALFIANHADPCMHVDCEVNLTLNGVNKICVTQAGKKTKIKNENGQFRLKLSPGDGAFITIK